MALIKCKECGNDVSTTADACPKCGAKIIVKIEPKSLGWLYVIFIVLALACILYANSKPRSQIESSSTSTTIPTTTSSIDLKEAVRSKLKIEISGWYIKYDTDLYLNLDIHNNSNMAVENIEATFEVIAYPYKRFEAPKKVFYGVFPASSVKSFKDVKIGWMPVDTKIEQFGISISDFVVK